MNEFRLDLLEYVKHHGDLDKTPFGLHAVVASCDDAPGGTIYILKNCNSNINVQNQNQLHPFYMVYVRDGAIIHIDHLQPKKMLDMLRQLCRGKDKPDELLCRKFNTETEDGKNMRQYSDLLFSAVNSIVDLNEENAMDSLFSGGGTTALTDNIDGLDDFELVCFIAVK